MDITACIVTYNNPLKVLEKAVTSFLNVTLDVKLYIVDNSADDKIELICRDPRVEYIHTESNIGFGAGHNIIMNNLEKLGTYHLVLNPDVEFGEEVLEALFFYMETHSDVGNLMPKVVYPNGNLQYLCKLLPKPTDWVVRMFIPLKIIKERIDYNLEMRFADYNKEMNVPYLSGCFMFLRKSVIEDIGIFDEGIFMYGEDTDLNRRIYRKYRTMYYPKVSIIHNFEKGSHKSTRLLWIHIKAAIYYLNKWGWFFDKERSIINRKTKDLYSTKYSDL